jgi:hypothetical protein
MYHIKICFKLAVRLYTKVEFIVTYVTINIERVKYA